ncbi:MAG: SRPBCC domain-containing protein [Bacteroidia bacterium]|nr:SRPBCC domain-containing protein [Bacteroidia bacterium]
MQKLTYSVEISAPADIVWNVLWEKESYEQWTKPFSPGSTYDGSFEAEGNRVHFHNGEGGGMYSVVARRVENELLSIRHLGVLGQNGEELPPTADTEQWSNIFEDYTLTPTENGVRLDITLDMDDAYADFMNDAFTRALDIIKSLSEQQTQEQAT